MIIRFLAFIIIVLVFIVLVLAFIKDLGENRRTIEKKAKEDIIKNSNQDLWKQGPKRRK